jgi:hypothetical protein
VIRVTGTLIPGYSGPLNLFKIKGLGDIYLRVYQVAELHRPISEPNGTPNFEGKP